SLHCAGHCLYMRYPNKHHGQDKNSPTTKNQHRNTPVDAPAFDLAKHHFWTIDDYGPNLTGQAAEKLYDSAVAPVVAAARGYWRADTNESYHQWAEAVGLQKTQKMYLTVRDGVVGTDENGDSLDGLVMPWYSVKHMYLARDGKDTTGYEPELQLRPAQPVELRAGKQMKYIFAKGASMYLDIHPATPSSWLSKAPVVLFAEGLLKGDAAMTAHLIAHGADTDLLTDTSDEAADRLMEFMENLPTDSQVLVLRSPSATTFHKDPVSLGQLNLADRVAWMGFDADVAPNPRVWDQARKFRQHLTAHQKVRSVKLLSPTADEGGKDGIDDFLSHRGDWFALTDDDAGHLQDRLPERPKLSEDDLEPGSWRITDDFAGTEVLRLVTDEQGLTIGSQWHTNSYGLGGRIAYIEDRRAPSNKELLTGLVDDPVEVGSGNAFVGIEVSYRAGEDIITYTVE